MAVAWRLRVEERNLVPWSRPRTCVYPLAFDIGIATSPQVTLMINPENNDKWAMLVASLAPCVSAPWWEEVVYRGFLLPALSLFVPRPVVSVPLSGALFGLHHMMPESAIPLAALGTLWAGLYVASGNLAVTIVVHGSFPCSQDHLMTSSSYTMFAQGPRCSVPCLWDWSS